MIHSEMKYIKPAIVGYPLSYFANDEPFASWFRGLLRNASVKKQRTPLKKPGKVIKPDKTANKEIPEWTEHVFLDSFKTNIIDKGPYKGSYEYITDFSSGREIAIEVPRPQGTVLLFGREIKKGQTMDSCRIKFILEPKYGRLVQLEISGAVRFRLSRNLVMPVIERNKTWVDVPTKHVIVPLEGARLILGKNTRPRLTSPLHINDIIVRIAKTEMIVKLSELDLGGTAVSPKIRFKKACLMYINN
jgi:hypothetical protein